MASISNIFCALPQVQTNDEQFLELLNKPALRIERIVSTGQSSPQDFWYDQPECEWIILLQGEARLRFADQADSVHLKTGDFLNVAAHRLHRVDWTSPEQRTIWLAIYYTD